MDKIVKQLLRNGIEHDLVNLFKNDDIKYLFIVVESGVDNVVLDHLLTNISDKQMIELFRKIEKLLDKKILSYQNHRDKLQ